jgi:hypothetical protein
VFSMHNINVWNIWIMNEWILHNFHYEVVRCFVMKVFLLAFIFNMSHPTTKVALETIILSYVTLHIFDILA